MENIFKKTYAYDKYVKNGKDLEKTFEEFEHDILLNILMLMDFQADIPQIKASTEKFLKLAGKFMPKQGRTYDGGLELELYAFAYTADNLLYNFCDLMFISRMMGKEKVREKIDAYAGLNVQDVYNEIEKVHFSFTSETAFKVMKVNVLLTEKYDHEAPYKKGDGYDLERRKAFLKDICDVLECPYYEEIAAVAAKAAKEC